MKTIIVVIFLIKFNSTYANNDTILEYNPAELLGKIFNLNSSDLDPSYQEDLPPDQQPRQYGFQLNPDDNQDANIYEDQTPGQYGFYQPVLNDQDTNAFDDQSNGQYGLYQPSPGLQDGQDPNTFDQMKKKRKRRRRKPKKQQFQGYPGFQNSVGPGDGYLGNVPPRPIRRPARPSLASGALSSIVEALTSIAMYDDRQCVPRLLCEAAGGGNLGSSSLLNSVSGLQPLLTLLSAYNGLSTSPLFVFGRAAFLGMTSKNNPGTCRYAYPTCPTDPEQLVHYLNNHNGGFFRFFNAPQTQPQGQNVQQLYQHLSGQYGLLPRDQLDNYQEKPFSYGFQSERDNSIEERIQNKPTKGNYVEKNRDSDSFFRFPEEYNEFYGEDDLNGGKIRETKSLKFPDDPERFAYKPNTNQYSNTYSNTRTGKAVSFPENNKYITYNNIYEKPDYRDYIYDNKYNIYVKKQNDNDDFRTVYVVRGNGDVNHPEVVRLRPGETLPK